MAKPKVRVSHVAKPNVRVGLVSKSLLVMCKDFSVQSLEKAMNRINFLKKGTILFVEFLHCRSIISSGLRDWLGLGKVSRFLGANFKNEYFLANFFHR